MLELLYHRAIHSVKSIYLRNINLSLRDAWYFAAVKKLNFVRHAQLIHNEFHDEMRCDNMMMKKKWLTLKQASSALGIIFSPQLGRPSQARLRDMQRRPFFCWNCSSVGHSYSAPSATRRYKSMKLLLNPHLCMFDPSSRVCSW